MKRLLVTLLVVLAAPVFATTYYISSSGNDSNNGTSTATPWATLNSAYNHRLSFTSGDSILLKRGDTFYGMLWITGNATNVLVSTYGTGANPILIGDEPNVVWTNVTGHPGVYAAASSFPSEVVKVADTNGVLYTKLNQGALTLSAWLSAFTNGNWGFSVDTGSLIYIRTLNDLAPIQMRLFDFCCVQVSTPGVTVENMDIRRSYSGIVPGGVGTIVRNNSIQDSFFMGINCSDPFNQEISTNVITRTGWTSVYLNRGGSNWVHHNIISYATTNILGIAINGAELCGIGLQQGTNNLVEYNTVSNNVHCVVDFFLENSSVIRYNYGRDCGNAGSPDGTGLRYYNNIFYLPNGLGIAGGHHWVSGQSPSPDAGTNWIYNNVVWVGKPFGYAYFSATNASTGIILRNNIFVSSNTTANILQINPGINADYDLMFCPAGTPKWNYNNTNFSTLASLRTASGQEAHGIYTNAQFVSSAPILPIDFRLQAISPAIGAGIFLISGSDFAGNPILNPPSIGAYEVVITNSPSCSVESVQAAVDAAPPGSIVYVPAGTCQWTHPVINTNHIQIIALGTIIQDCTTNTSDNSRSSMFVINPTTTTPDYETRISGFTFLSGSNHANFYESGMINVGGTSWNVRIDGNTFKQGLNIGIGWSDAFGCIDHNAFIDVNFKQPMKIHHPAYGGGAYGDGAWALPSWTNSYQEDAAALYVENNVFTNASGIPGLGIDADAGARYVVRSNIFDRMIVGGHGTDTTGRFRGSRVKDMYNNIFVNHGDSEIGHWRSGAGMWATNAIYNSAGAMTIRIYRLLLGGFWKAASGTNAWDNNNATVFGSGTVTSSGSLSMTDTNQAWTVNQWAGYTIRNVTGGASVVQGNTATTATFSGSPDTGTSPNLTFAVGDSYQFRKVITALDEPGRGRGMLVSNTTPVINGIVQWPNEALDPVYNWNNTINGVPVVMNNGGYYPCVVGQEIVNGVNTNWHPFQYPHYLVSGTNVPPPVGPDPVIVIQPQSQTILAGGIAQFSVVATGNSGLIYQWSLNGLTITNATASTYTTNGVSINANGNSYTVRVRDAAGYLDSNAAILSVTNAPVPPSTHKKIHVHGSVSFKDPISFP